MMLLHIHMHLTDTLNHIAILNEFTTANDDRHRHFGLFHERTLIVNSSKFCPVSLLTYFIDCNTIISRVNAQSLFLPALYYIGLPNLHVYELPRP